MSDPPKLFAADAMPPAVRPASQPGEVVAAARRMPPDLYLGTSSWSFPGWVGTVWSGPRPSSVLARRGLSAYAAHPLFRTVGIDRTFYAPIPAETYQAYASQVPEDFRFVIKAPGLVCRPFERDGSPNPTFLDPAATIETWIGPATEGLGERCGVLAFVMPPFDPARLGGPDAFADRLQTFLDALPEGPRYAVEARDRRLIVRRWAEALRSGGAAHVVSVFPGMPTVATQGRVAAAAGNRFHLVRWMLHPAWTYERAKEAFHPFDRLKAPCPEVRDEIADLIAGAAEAESIFVIANNKAEGAAPLTLQALAEALRPPT